MTSLIRTSSQIAALSALMMGHAALANSQTQKFPRTTSVQITAATIKPPDCEGRSLVKSGAKHINFNAFNGFGSLFRSLEPAYC